MNESNPQKHLCAAMTFNIGTVNISDLDTNVFITIFKKHFENPKIELPDILILGLQEVPDSHVKPIADEFEQELNNINNLDDILANKIKDKQYRFIKSYKNTHTQKYIKTCKHNFNILSMVIVSNKITELTDQIEIYKYCPGISNKTIKTKGFTKIKFNYKFNNILQPTLHIINLHAPFKTSEKSISFFNTLYSKLSDLDINKNNIIILGDFNSRSLITSTKEYIKKIEPSICSDKNKNNPNKYYCNVKSQLETIKSNNKLYGAIPEKGKLNNTVINLTAANFFNNNIAPLFNNFKIKEYKIHFLPSYKRITSTQRKEYSNSTLKRYSSSSEISYKPSSNFKQSIAGRFILEKGTVKKLTYRLPGYADRIIVVGDHINLLDKNMYSTLPIFGNDHLPVVATFEIN